MGESPFNAYQARPTKRVVSSDPMVEPLIQPPAAPMIPSAALDEIEPFAFWVYMPSGEKQVRSDIFASYFGSHRATWVALQEGRVVWNINAPIDLLRLWYVNFCDDLRSVDWLQFMAQQGEW